MSETNFVPVQTVTADGQVIWHDDSADYLESMRKFEQRKNAEYLERVEKLEQEERLQRAFAENLRPKKVKAVKKSTKLSGVMGW